MLMSKKKTRSANGQAPTIERITPNQLEKLRIMCRKAGFPEDHAIKEWLRDEFELHVPSLDRIPREDMPGIFAVLESGKYGGLTSWSPRRN